MNNIDKHLLAKVGQYILIGNGDRKVLLLRRISSKNWSLPGGRLNGDEIMWRESLIREVKEETGLTIEDAKPFDIKIIKDAYQVKYCVYFTCNKIKIAEINISSEHDSWKWFTKDDLKSVIIDDEPMVRQVIELFLTK